MSSTKSIHFSHRKIRIYNHPVLPIKMTSLECRGRTAVAMEVNYEDADTVLNGVKRFHGSGSDTKNDELIEEEGGGCRIEELI